MKVDLVWNGKMQFTARAREHAVPLDALPPIGTGGAMTPKELLLAAVCGCTAMDVAALLRKHKQKTESLEVHAEASSSEGGHPVVFRSIKLVFEIAGAVDAATALDAVRASQTQFCGVSAMLTRGVVPIAYEVRVNGQSAGAGEARFD